MPNWCCGQVYVTGLPKNIEAFCKYFIFDEEEGKKGDSDEQFFARSFVHDSWKYFKKNDLGGDEVNISVDFAWSAHSCLIEGYPNGKDCITLVDACKKHKVDVVIDTEEGGMGFEEHIECTNEGVLTEECKDMPEYKCKKCGSEHWIPSTYPVDEEPCYECDVVGQWEAIK